MEKIKFTVQIITLVLALPVWFFAEMKRTDKAIRAQQVNKVDSISAKREYSSQAGGTTYSFDLTTNSMEKVMLKTN
jgi:hypothetical protein